MTFIEVDVEDREGNLCASCGGSMITGGSYPSRPERPAVAPERQI
jgi:hypothetical protein